MIIGIDGNEANIEKRVGVNQYAFELLWGFYRLRKNWEKKHKLIVYLKNEPMNDLPPAFESLSYNVILGGRVWILTKLMPYLFFNHPRPDVFFTPSHYLPPFAPMPKVCSIMDLGYLEFSAQFKKYDFWQLKWWSAWSMIISKCIIAISESTKNDIVRHYKFASKKTYVTHLGYDSDRFNTKISKNDVRRIQKKYSIVSDYILYIGTLKPSKNVEGLLDAFYKVRVKYPNIQLVVAGKKGWLYNTIFEKAKKLDIVSHVIFTDYMVEEDKPALIRGAKVFVTPSYWEGFGLDILNAMGCGVPVVASNVGSLPEVLGSAGILVNPKDYDSIATGIEKVLSASKFQYNMIVAYGLKQAAKFSWDKTALKTLGILERSVTKK